MTETAPELTAELVVDSAGPAQPVISPDGRWVAYAVAPTGKRGERRLSALWLAAADGSSPPRQLTAGTPADSAPRWAPDSASLFFVSDRTGSAQLHRIRLNGGEAEALTAWRGGIDGHYPLAGHELVVYPREGHGFTERNHQLDLLRRTRAWFDRWLGDPGPGAVHPRTYSRR